MRAPAACSIKRCVYRCPGEQAGGIEPGQRAIIRPYEQGNLGATENHAIAAARPHTVDDFVIAQAGGLG